MCKKKFPHSDGVFFTLVTDIQKVYLSVNRPLPKRVMRQMLRVDERWWWM